MCRACFSVHFYSWLLLMTYNAAFQALTEYRAELRDDPIINTHLAKLYDSLLEQNLIRVIEPFSRVQVRTHKYTALLLRCWNEWFNTTLCLCLQIEHISGLIKLSKVGIYAGSHIFESSNHPVIWILKCVCFPSLSIKGWCGEEIITDDSG